MFTFWGLSTAGWAALAALGALLTAAVAAISAVAAFRQVREARRVREEQTRPYVVVSVEPSSASRHLLDVVIRNVGITPALDTRIRVDPPLKRAQDHSYPIAQAKIFNEPIAMIAPGFAMTVFLDSGLERKDRPDLPTAHTATVSYTDSSGKRYDALYSVDLAAQEGASWVDALTIHDAAKALKDIGKSLGGAKSSLLSGRLETTVETRRGAARRISRERGVAQARHVELMARLGRHRPAHNQRQGFLARSRRLAKRVIPQRKRRTH